MEVELLDAVFPATPIVVGRLRGDRPGRRSCSTATSTWFRSRTRPPGSTATVIYGRGSADMKGACACAARGRAACWPGGPFAGRARRSSRSACTRPPAAAEKISPGCSPKAASAPTWPSSASSPVPATSSSHMGQATAEITISRPGMPTHELLTPQGRRTPCSRRRRSSRRSAPVGGAGGDGAPLGRGRDVLRRRAARRRLLQPVSVHLPDRGHAALGAREHPGGRRGRIPLAPGRRRGGDGMRDRPRAEARARPVRDLDRPSPAAALQKAYLRSPVRS